MNGRMLKAFFHVLIQQSNERTQIKIAQALCLKIGCFLPIITNTLRVELIKQLTAPPNPPRRQNCTAKRILPID